MKAKYILLFLYFGLSTVFLRAQQSTAIDPPTDKKKIELRPNSRDYGPVVRGNSFERVDRQRNRTLFMKARPSHKGKFLKPGKKQGVKKDVNQRRRQMMMQRRMLRK